MSTLTDFMAVHTLEAKAAKKPAGSKPHAVRRAGHQAPKPKTAPPKAPPAAKSMAGLQRKLDAIAKKYVKDCPKLTIAIKEYKNKQNTIIVTGIAKMPVATFNELAKELPNTSHIPQAHSGNAAIFTLFGKKELTGSAPGQPSQTGLREMMTASAPANAPIKPVAVTAPTRINRFMTEGFKKKVLTPGNITASVNLNPAVGDVGVVFEDPTNTDDEFVASGHENQGTRLRARVKEVKDQKLKVDILASDNSVKYQDAWIFATQFFKSQSAAIVAALTDPDMIDSTIATKVAESTRGSRAGYMRVGDLRRSLKNLGVSKDDLDAALTRMHMDQVVQLGAGSITDTDTVDVGKDKFNRIYPSDQLKEIYASDDLELEQARRTFKRAKKLHDDDPGPETQAQHRAAKKQLAKVLQRVMRMPAVPYAGPPKAKRMPQRMAASEITGISHQQNRVRLEELAKKSSARRKAIEDELIEKLGSKHKTAIANHLNRHFKHDGTAEDARRYTTRQLIDRVHGKVMQDMTASTSLLDRFNRLTTQRKPA